MSSSENDVSSKPITNNEATLGSQSIDITPSPSDVIGGKGRNAAYHTGNKYYNDLIRQHRNAFHNCPNFTKKREVASKVINEIKGQRLPGRFLFQNNNVEGKPWMEYDDEKVMMKVLQALREKRVGQHKAQEYDEGFISSLGLRAIWGHPNLEKYLPFASTTGSEHLHEHQSLKESVADVSHNYDPHTLRDTTAASHEHDHASHRHEQCVLDDYEPLSYQQQEQQFSKTTSADASRNYDNTYSPIDITTATSHRDDHAFHYHEQYSLEDFTAASNQYERYPPRESFAASSRHDQYDVAASHQQDYASQRFSLKDNTATSNQCQQYPPIECIATKRRHDQEYSAVMDNVAASQSHAEQFSLKDNTDAQYFLSESVAASHGSEQYQLIDLNVAHFHHQDITSQHQNIEDSKKDSTATSSHYTPNLGLDVKRSGEVRESKRQKTISKRGRRKNNIMNTRRKKRPEIADFDEDEQLIFEEPNSTSPSLSSSYPAMDANNPSNIPALNNSTSPSLSSSYPAMDAHNPNNIPDINTASIQQSTRHEEKVQYCFLRLLIFVELKP